MDQTSPHLLRKIKWALASLLAASAAGAGADVASLRDQLGIAAKLPVHVADLEPSVIVRPANQPITPAPVAPAQPAKASASPQMGPAGRPLSPKRLAKLQARGLVDDLADASMPADRPALISLSAAPLPSMPAFAEGARLVVTPTSANLPVRIPNLLSGPKRQIITAANPLLTPALPIGTPTVCNVEGTATLAGLAPFKREIAVEVTAPPAALGLDESPYLQAPEANDELEPPVDRHAIPPHPKMN